MTKSGSSEVPALLLGCCHQKPYRLVAVVVLLLVLQSIVTTHQVVGAFVSRNSRKCPVKPTLNTFSTTSLNARASRIDDWVLTRDGRIEGKLRDSGDLVKTSVLADPTVAGKNVVVTTSSGSRYKLMKPAKAAAVSTATTTSSDRSTRPLLSEALERFQRQQQQQEQGQGQDESVVSTSTDSNKFINPTTAVLGTSAAVALGATIGSGVLGDGTKNSFNLQQSFSKQGNQIVQSVGSTFQGVVQDKKLPSVSLPNVDLPNVNLPGVPDVSLPGPVNDFIDDNLGQLKNKFKKSPTPAITPYVVKLPYLEEKIETAEQKQQAVVPAPAAHTPATTQAAQRKAAQEKAAQDDFQRKLREAEEAAAREKKLEAEAAAAKAKAAAEAENKLLEMEAQQAAMRQQQAANEFATKLAQAEAAASVAKETPQQQAKPATADPAKSASQTSATFEKWQAAQRAKAQQLSTVDPIKQVPAKSLKPPAAGRAATATTSKLSTYEEWQARQRALREGAAASEAYRPLVPNAPAGSVGRMTSSEEAFIALTGVGISAATLGSVFTRKGSWDEAQATPASEISNQRLRPRAPINPPPKKKMIEDLPKKLQQPPPLPVQPQVVQQQQQQFTPPPPPEPATQVPPPPPPVVAPPTPEPAPAPAAEVITSPTHEIARPDSESKAAVASNSDGNYLQALGGGSGSSPKKSYSPFGAKKPAAPSAGSLYSPPGGAGGGAGDSADSASSFSFTNQDSVSSMSDWSPPIPPAGSLSSKMKPSAYSPFGGGKKPVAASSSGDTLYTPPSSIEPVDSLSSSSSPSLSEVAPSSTAEDTMFFTNGPAVNGDADQLGEGTNDVYENTNGYEYEASSDSSSSNDDYTVQPTTAGDPIPYASMPGTSFTSGAAVMKPSSYSPFGSKPKASSNDSLYGPPS